MVDMLIMRGARINVMNRGDDTPLHLAASHGHRDIVGKVAFDLLHLTLIAKTEDAQILLKHSPFLHANFPTLGKIKVVFFFFFTNEKKIGHCIFLSVGST